MPVFPMPHVCQPSAGVLTSPGNRVVSVPIVNVNTGPKVCVARMETRLHALVVADCVVAHACPSFSLLLPHSRSSAQKATR